MSDSINAHVLLRGWDVSVLVDLTGGRLPAIVHWGSDVGDLSAPDVAMLALAAVPPVGPNEVDEPIRVSILPEHWTGWVGRPGLSGSRAGRSWSPKFTTSTLAVDGTAVMAGTAEPLVLRGTTLDVEASDESAALGLRLQVELAAGGLLRSRATLTNNGSDPYQLDDLVLAYPVPSAASELLDFAGRWGKERVPQRRAFTIGTHLREGRKGRTGADAATVLHAGSVGFSFASGTVWGVHLGWSGNHTHYAERAFTGEQVLGGGELLLPGEVVLAAGESYTSPWLYGSYGIGLDQVARRFHRWLRARPSHPSSRRPVTINVWEAVYFDHSLPPLLELAETAASIGVERYVLDDGWFGSRRNDRSGLGDWTVSTDAWPNGLHPLVDRVRDLGMEFGLWFEPEMVSLDSDLAREHPNWLMAAGARLPVPSRHQQVLNLGLEECFAHVRAQMFAILAEYDITYLKWDHNRDLIEAGTQPDGRPGVHAQTLATYRLIDELRAAHPGLEIESCSSGGARVDLGILERTDRVWVSDCIDPHERQQMLRWTAQLVPLEMLGSHVASGTSHTTGRTHDLSFRAATAILGHLGIEWDLRNASTAELADLAGWISFYKANRDLVFGGDFFRIDHPDEAIVGSAVVAPDRSRAIYSYALSDSRDVSLPGRLPMPGLDGPRRYRVAPVLIGAPPSGLTPPPWWRTPEVVLPGSVLASPGLVQAAINPDQAILYLAEAVD